MEPADETIGVLAHPGGMLVDRPELTVGLLQAVSRPAGLEIELVARRPRAGQEVRPRAERRLLPEYDEGLELRLAVLDDDGRAEWAYPTRSSGSSGGTGPGGRGPMVRTLFRLRPLFDAASFVLAWPEIGFPETIVRLPLADRATVERGTVPLWAASAPAATPVPDGVDHRDDSPADVSPADEVDAEKGRAAAAPRVLRRADDVVVVLDRLTVSGPVLSMQIRCQARGAAADRIQERVVHPPDVFRRVVKVGVLDGVGVRWLRSHEGGAGGGPGSFTCEGDYVFARPDGDSLNLVTGWPEAGLSEACVIIPLTEH